MPRPKGWLHRPEVVGYIIDCYAGTDVIRRGGAEKRQFMWQEEGGDILIGNTRAFTDHLSKKFEVHVTDFTWTEVHRLLRELGEKLCSRTKQEEPKKQKFVNQPPESKVVGHAPSADPAGKEEGKEDGQRVEQDAGGAAGPVYRGGMEWNGG